MDKIDGNELYAYIVSGAKNIIVNENNLNRINVFPVPDGDTGTNLSLTMGSIINSATRLPQAFSTMRSIAQIAVDNAYGNSGVIFAQYLHGLSQSIGQREMLTASEFVSSLKSSALYAHSSVANPKEGTILTVMREWANTLEIEMEDDFAHVIEHSLEHLKAAVQHTKQQLKVLKDANVVDAGAQAFYFFVEGIVKFLKGHSLENLEYTAAILDEVSETLTSVEIGEYRYCAQYLVETQTDTQKILDAVQRFGGSIVVGSTNAHVNLHIHTNQPDKVLVELLKYGILVSHKVDDMALQAKLIHQPLSKIALVTDSIADLPKSFIDAHHVVVIPMNLIVDSIVYQDKLTMTAENFYQHLDDYSLNPTSSQATKKTIERTFRSLLQNYDHVLGIFVSSKMSGTYENIRKITSRLTDDPNKIVILDSKTNSVAQGLLVMHAARLKDQGVDFATLVESVKSKIDDARIYVSVKDLKYMLRGGRVSKVTGIFASLLKLKPVISIDQNGKGEIFAKSLNQRSALRSILKTVKKDLVSKGIEEYALVYADEPTDLRKLNDECVNLIGKAPTYIETISPIVGLNAGKGAIAIGYLTK